MAKNNFESTSDVAILLHKYAQKWWMFLISVCLCVSAAFVYTKVKNPLYEVKGNILVSDDNATAGLLSGSLGDIFGSGSQVDDELFVVASHSLFYDVAKSLQLNKTHVVKTGLLTKYTAYYDYPVDIMTPHELADTLSVDIVFKVAVKADGKASVTAKAMRKTIAEVENAKFPIVLKTIYGRYTLMKTKDFVNGKDFKTYIKFSGYHPTAEELAEDIDVTIASKKSNVINLAYATTDPIHGKEVINEVIKKYNERGLRQKNLQGQQTLEFLDDRIKLITAGLDEAESTIQDFKQRNGIIDLASETAFEYTRKNTYDAAIVEAETNLEILKMTGDFISDPANAYNLIPTTPTTGNMGAGIDAYNELILNRMELEGSAKHNNTALKQLNERIDAMRKNINTSLTKAIESAKIQLNDLKAQKNISSSKLDSTPSHERTFINMKRQQEIKQELYLFLLKNREETAMLIANSTPKGVIIDPAFTLKETLGMGRMAILVLGFIIGLILPIAYLYLRQMLRTKFDSVEELGTLTDISILGEVCASRSGKSLVVDDNTYSSAAELIRLIRANLQFLLNDKSDRVVLITSTKSGEGKSFISINLAASLALLGKRVLLIGMDIRNPQLANYLNLDSKVGITNYLSGSAEAEDVILKNPLKNGLDLIVGGPIPPNPSELLLSNRLEELFATLRTQYDYILIDSAPVGMVSDTFSIERITDVTLYVCRAGYTTHSDIRFVNGLKNDNRLRRVSLILNGTKTKKGYGYGYGQK